jgi:E3 ubiquitin-protein ligase RNF14
MSDDLYADDRREELEALAAIYPELETSKEDPFSARLVLDVAPLEPLNVKFVAAGTSNGRDAAITEHAFSRLPPLEISVALPPGYPYDAPPDVRISTTPAWLPPSTLDALAARVPELWAGAGRAQVVYDVVVALEQEIEAGFRLAGSGGGGGGGGSYELDAGLRLALLDFSARAERAHFDRMTFVCGVCLAPKKGAACYRMRRCGHVFCRGCIEGFYTSCITEGDIGRVQCMAAECRDDSARGRSRKTIPPAELLQIPLARDLVQRYADLKRKKKMELDKTVAYCPRAWCGSPARSSKYPKVTDLAQMTDVDDAPDGRAPPPPPPPPPPLEGQAKETAGAKPVVDDRLVVCENEECGFAFCRLCKRSWHGEFLRCGAVGPRDEAELSKEEKASEEYIRRNTSECPSCLCAVQKSRGCNHMTCFQCRTHFCYICGFWLDPDNPYRHFNQKGKGCYNRLWDLEGGDEADGEVDFAGARGWEAAVGDLLLD